MILQVEVTPVFEKIHDASTRFVVNQGGTRSSKTYSTIQWLVFVYCQRNTGKVITICRKTFPTLRITVMRDFFDILMKTEVYDRTQHNKTDHTYTLNGNLIEFISLDDPQKKRGAKRDVLFINEANEFNYEDFFQLNTRTSELVFIDFNPSEKFWVHQHIVNREDCTFIKSTYLDNPFLERSIVAEIERMKLIDPDYWRIYGLGELGIPKEVVYPYHNIVPEPRGTLLGRGLDFGFTADPSALIDLYQDGDDIIIDQQIYRTGLTSPDIYNEALSIGIDMKVLTIADNARPEMIEDLRRRGWRIVAVKKPKIQERIDLLKRYRINVTQRSKDVIRELESYRYKVDKFGNMTNEPIDANNHALDAVGYAGWHFLARPNVGKYLVGGVR